MVRSHIIPQAFTRPESPGAALEQLYAGPGNPKVIRRYTSWYDRNIVTDAGERILAVHDEQGIRELRRQRLVWSSWGEHDTLQTTDHKFMEELGLGVRQLNNVDSEALRSFFLSVLWRAAASKLPEFEAIQLSPEEFSILTSVVHSGESTHPAYYPMTLTQFCSRGFPFNYAAVADEKLIPRGGGTEFDEVPIFRFFMDGLVIHVHRAPHPTDSGPATLGSSSELLVTTLPFEESIQAKYLLQSMTKCIELEARK